MKIYTSYFANLQNLLDAEIYPVAICWKVPDFFSVYPNIESVAPSTSILIEYKKSDGTEKDKERYKQRYYDEILCAYRFHPEYLTGLLESFSEAERGKDIAMCCYERPEDFCHRHLLADWFNERSEVTGHFIEEYPVYPEKKETSKKEKPVSYALF